MHCICISLYFRDHTNRLVRVDPLRNLPLGYLTPSPISSNPIDLCQFPLVDIESIPMDQHKQDPLGHVIGGAHHRQYVVDRVIKDHERTSNAREVEAQIRTMRDYMNPK